jgi:hypothetical protein
MLGTRLCLDHIHMTESYHRLMAKQWLKALLEMPNDARQSADQPWSRDTTEAELSSEAESWSR